MENVDHELLNLFLQECSEILNQFYNDLKEIGKNHNNTEKISSIFRLIHTIKGSAGVLGFSRLEALSLAGENLICQIKNGNVNIHNEIIETLTSLYNAFISIIANIKETQTEGDDAYLWLIRDLDKFLSLNLT
ncbi:Hpt domain-containing protein [bacterium]|nr:Hpt domain-containing protein [bacterium]